MIAQEKIFEFNSSIVREVMREPKRIWLTDLQLRMELSKEKCRETAGAILTGDICPDCRFYMFWLKSSVMSCEFCRTEREWAQTGRTLLQKAELGLQGIVIDPYTPPFEIIEPEKPEWPLIGGMSL